MRKSRKKIFALILSLIMLLDVTPLFVFAEDELAVDRSESQTVESLMTPAVNRKNLLFGAAPAGSQVDNRVTAEVYFLNTDGTRTDQVETASGNTLNARINLSNSNANNSEDAYVKVSLAGLSDYVKLNEKFKANDWDSITFRDMSTGLQYVIGVYYDTSDDSLTYRVKPGATGIVALSFTAPNGVTPDETTMTLTPSLVDSNRNPITPQENDKISGPASGKWMSSFVWDPIQKYVNSAKENTVVVTNNGGTPVIDSWLHYEYSASSQNRAETGVRWTKEAYIEDSLTLPDHMSFAGTYTCDNANGRIYIDGATAPDNILFGLTLKPNMQCTELTIDGKTIHYKIKVTNPNTNRTDGLTNDLSAEMDNISYITELNAAGITLDPAYITTEYYGEVITNAVSITEKPCKGTDDQTSLDQVKTRTKKDEGFSLSKDSLLDGEYVAADETIDYTITVTNTGTATISAAESIVYDTLPAGVYLPPAEITRLQNVYGDKITIEGDNKITFRTGEMAPGASVTLTVYAKVRDSKALEQAGYTDESTITNTATYRGLSDYVSSKLHAGHAIAEKNSNKAGITLKDGEQVNYTLTAKNDTPYPYTGEVTLTDYLPGYLRVTFFDANGNDITNTVYAQLNSTPANCHVKDTAGNLVDAVVTIDGAGRTTVKVIKDGLPANSQYSVILTATFDESKAEGTVNDEGNIRFTNYVTVNNTHDQTDITVAVGKLDLDKYVSGATKEGTSVSQPFSDGTEVTYTIHVTNDQANPYKHDIVVTDTMPRGLVPMGLTVGGTVYNSWNAFVAAFGWEEKDATVMDADGYQQSVKAVQTYNGLKLTWTIPNSESNLITSAEITYKALIRTDELVNQSSGLQELENTATAAGREDKEIIVVDVKGIEISKKIVGPNEELLDTIEIGPGAVVTYELTIENPEHLNTTVTGITDFLPQGGPGSAFPLSYWALGSTVLVDTTTDGKNQFYSNAKVDSYYGSKCWFDPDHNLRFGDIEITSAQERLVQRITLKYPDDPDVLHAMFVDTVWWGRQQKNQYTANGMPRVEVDHTEVTNKKFYVQKSVIGLSKYYSWNFHPIKSKDLFKENDVEYVFYTVMVVNNGTGTLHINSLTDILPPELEFEAIAPNDYNAGTHIYSSSLMIETSDQYNNPNYVRPSGYTGLAGVMVSASFPSGNEVLFTLNSGAGVDLPEKCLLAFDVQCKLKTNVTLTDGQAITNTFRADLESDATLSKMAITTQKTPDDTIQNNGSCKVIFNDGTHQIAESSVTVHPMNAALPGILKKAVAYKAQADTAWTELKDNTTNINSQSEVKWKITLYNDGTIPLDGGYTLTDLIYKYQELESVESFTINGVAKSTQADPFTGWTTEQEGDYNKVTFTFPQGSDYTIPVGGKAEMVLVTTFTSGQYQGLLDNKAIFSPVQQWDSGHVIHGKLEKNEEGTAYIGVSSMDYVDMLGDGATVSYKIVTDKNDPSNRAYGYNVAEDRNYITVDDTQIVTYTNHVQNLTNGTFKEFVMIDRMPELGDTGVINAHEQRGSEFSINFADSLNFTLTLRNSDGTKSISITDSDYTLEFSDKTAFTQEDWAGTSTWNASPATAKSFRLKLNADSLTPKVNEVSSSSVLEAVFPSKWVLEVSYDGKLSADATAGQSAWNSFGYYYKTGNGVSLPAEPLKAGVRLKPHPVLKKQVVDDAGVDQGIDTSVSFNFKFYEGSHTLDQLASLTPVWQVTLYQGEAVELEERKTVNNVTSGHFIEGQEYTVVEEGKAGYTLVGYEKDGLKQPTVGYCVFTYSNQRNTTIVCKNKPVRTFELPATGGPGTLPWVLSGLALALLALIILAVRKRKATVSS